MDSEDFYFSGDERDDADQFYVGLYVSFKEGDDVAATTPCERLATAIREAYSHTTHLIQEGRSDDTKHINGRVGLFLSSLRREVINQFRYLDRYDHKWFWGFIENYLLNRRFWDNVGELNYSYLSLAESQYRTTLTGEFHVPELKLGDACERARGQGSTVVHHRSSGECLNTYKPEEEDPEIVECRAILARLKEAVDVMNAENAKLAQCNIEGSALILKLVEVAST